MSCIYFSNIDYQTESQTHISTGHLCLAVHCMGNAKIMNYKKKYKNLQLHCIPRFLRHPNKLPAHATTQMVLILHITFTFVTIQKT